jgi:hypothetical protein
MRIKHTTSTKKIWKGFVHQNPPEVKCKSTAAGKTPLAYWSIKDASGVSPQFPMSY